MGREVCRAVSSDPDLSLVGAVDPQGAGQVLAIGAGAPGSDRADQIVITAGPDDFEGRQVDVAVDFTRASAAMENLRWCAAHGVHAVVGTTGFSPNEESEIGEMFAGGPPNCVLAANFAIGAVLMMHFAEVAAPYMSGAEIIEMHHRAKLDVPSGTAAQTAKRIIAAGLGAERSGARGVRSDDASVPVHSVRLEGMLSHQEVVFGGPGQVLTIRHDSLDRSSFMPGVLLAIKAVGSHPGLTIGLEKLLNMA
jgi:4-hydroxy-tetrahydrodipicolinate reductase